MKKVTDYPFLQEGEVETVTIKQNANMYSFKNKFDNQIVNQEGEILASSEDIKNKNQYGSFIAGGYLNFVTGDIMNTNISRHKIILNLCSLSGQWEDSSLHTIIDNKWKNVGYEFRKWYHSQYKFILGELQEVIVQSDMTVMNVLVYDVDNKLDNKILDSCLNKVAELAKLYNSTVYAHNTGDEWSVIEKAIIDKIIRNGITVSIFG
jgi:hypothetical protein